VDYANRRVLAFHLAPVWDDANPVKTTTRTIREAKGVKPVVCLTAYDVVTARIADAGGADLILVGDSVGNVVLGFENTVSVTVPMMIHHVSAVARAKPKALVVGDIPFGVAQDEWTKVLGVCTEFLRAGAEAVKIEGGVEIAPVIQKLVSAGIPVVGHIGLQPQQVLALGGYRKFGKTETEQEKIFADARAVSDAGAFCIVVEMVDSAFATKLTAACPVPIIGIGAGTGCDGQILVIHDLLGLSGNYPSFAKPRVELEKLAVEAVAGWAAEVRKRP
jgi:3-methyl-2-oxobutanoate hydroxymethyltransferase